MPFGKWKDFDACVADFVRQGKDEESAKRICGSLQARLGKESFSWVGDINQHEKNLIRGKALHPIKTVHPEEWPTVRVYLEEELEKAAHSLAGTPLFLDHMYPLDGKVISAEYEDGAIEYVAELNDERVLDWVSDGTIEHCSVEYDWSSLVKLNGVAPKGLQFTGLALLKNFEPGDADSSVEIWKQIAEAVKEAKARTPAIGESSQQEVINKLLEEVDVSPEPTLDEVVQSVEDALSEINHAIDQINEKIKALQSPKPQVTLEQTEEKFCSNQNLEETVEALHNELTTITDQKRALQEQVKTLMKEKADLTKKLGEAVIEPHEEQEDFKKTILKELKAAAFERVPQHWGYGPYEQNRRIKSLIKRLENS